MGLISEPVEMLDYCFLISYQPGSLYCVADAHPHSSAISALGTNHEIIKKLHESVGNPGSCGL